MKNKSCSFCSVFKCYYGSGEIQTYLPPTERLNVVAPFIMPEYRDELFDIPIELTYHGKGLVDIVRVIEVFDRATRSESSTVLLQRCLEEMQSKLQEVSGRSL